MSQTNETLMQSAEELLYTALDALQKNNLQYAYASINKAKFDIHQVWKNRREVEPNKKL